MNKDEMFGVINNLLDSQHFGVLATRGEEFPYCSLIGFVKSDGAKELLFATIRSTRKYQNLKRHAPVSLLVNNQTNSINDFKDARALTVLGRAIEVDDAKKFQAQAEYLKRHPFLQDFVMDPNCALIKLEVAKYILVENFQNVLEYKMS